MMLASAPDTRGPRARPRRWLRRSLQLAGASLVLVVGVLLVAGCAGFGRSPSAEHQVELARSPQWKDDRFVNPQPLHNDFGLMMKGLGNVSPDASPKVAVPVAPITRDRFAMPPASGLRVTWLGHSTVFLEIDGQRVLTDPIWSDRASPISFVGPRRYYPPLVALADLPRPDVVVVSHDHYDHLDHRTIAAMKDWHGTRFVVPLGLGAHLAGGGVPAARITELDWWEQTAVGKVTVVATPARHASGRILLDNDEKLWAGYAFVGPRHRVYFSGDTGLFPAVKEIGSRLGPFDLTLIEVGQYDAAWPDWHIGPEQAVRAHELVRGRVLLPIHWGLFTLAYHSWTEPIERTLEAARAVRALVATPKPGESIEVGSASTPPTTRWWPSLPWRSAEEAPVVSTQLDGLNSASSD